MKYYYGCLAAVVSVMLLLGHDWLRLQYDAHHATKAATPWLLSHQSEITDPGVIWILSKINKDYCGDNPKTAAVIEKMFKPFTADTTEVAYGRLLYKEFTYTVSTSSLTKQATHFDNMLIPALYCDKQPDLIADSLHQALELGEGTDYQVTHALLALVWLKERNCLPENQNLDTVTQSIYFQQNQTLEFSDLFAERTAFLQYADSRNHIPNTWLRTIIDSQGPSGGWKTKPESYIFGVDENTHTTALSLWALTEFTHSCPF
jgi:hypothetical protein